MIRDYPNPAAPFDILPELVGFGRSNVVDLRWYALSPHQVLRAVARAELARRARMEAEP